MMKAKLELVDKENEEDILYIVIPAYNECETIEKVAKEWHREVENVNSLSRLVIIDDGSKDSTYEKLNMLKRDLPQLISLKKKNSGHGSTILFGYQYALEHGADYIFQTDSDGQTLPSEFIKFWESRKNDLVIIGNRTHRQDGLSRIVVTKVLKLVIKLIFSIKIVDANTPYRLMPHAVLEKYINIVPKDYNLTNVLLTVLFTLKGEKIEYYPITFQKRQGGKNSINIPKIIKIGIKAVKDFRKIKDEIE